MLRHRLCKFGHAMFFALCVLFTGSIIQSCTDELDEYKYDDEYPEWLGASIYDFLKSGNHNGRTYNTLIAIIDTLGQDDVLARTGSKTLFVSDDDAFARFFANNNWGVSSLEELSITQMRILLFGSMLDNTYLLDMMSCLPSEGGNDPVEGTCLRRDISLGVIDSVPYFTSDMLPKYNKYWDRFRAENGGEGLLLALDATEPMMVHLLREYVKAQRITERDINILFNADRSTARSGDEAFIYGNQIIASGIDYGEYSDDTLTITCKNGFVYRMNNVLVPPQNMAQELRQHPRTKIFSHLLDRFSVPVYASTLTGQYNEYHENTEAPDSVFEMRYLNYSSVRPFHYVKTDGGVGTVSGDEKPDYSSLLPYDPGWNRFKGDANAKEGADMAAILAPSDEAMYEFFANGAGKFLLEQFAPDAVFSKDDLTSIIPALDSIPQENIGPLLEILMLPSFVDYVPSKFDQVYDQGSQDPLNLKEEHVEECVIANNGVIYILNNAFAPAKYRSVSAPTLILDNMLIIQEAINQLGYDSYLLAMGTDYSFFVPDNDYFIYYDPATVESQSPLAYRFSAKRTSSNDISLYAVPYTYNPETYELSAEPAKITSGSSVKYRLEEGTSGYTVKDEVNNFERKNIEMTWSGVQKNSPGGFLRNRFTDLLDYLIVLGNVEDGNKYYRSKGYGSIKCDINTSLRDSDGNLTAEAFTFYGGEQLENGKAIKVAERFPEENGVTYCTIPMVDDTLQSGIPTPPTQSIYYKLKKSDEANGAFSEFYNLCMGPEEQSLGDFFRDMYPDIDTDSLETDSVMNYSIFYGTKSESTGRNVPRDMAVPFFTSYHYTLYVPNNEAVEKMYDMGLPTWEELQAELGVFDADAEGDDENADDEEGSDEDETIVRPAKYKKVAAYIRLINKFLRYHFQDNSVFVDNNVSGATYETASLNDATGRFFELEVVPGVGSLKILGEYEGNGGRNSANVVTSGEENKTWNIMTRDLLLYCKNGNSMSPLSEYGAAIETSSFAVVHEIDNALLNSALIGYDGMFRRYANEGGLIDKVNLAASDYIVEHIGNKEIVLDSIPATETEEATVETTEQYLYHVMRTVGGNDKLNKEEYILDEQGNSYLVDSNGYWCAKVYDEESETYSYRYVSGYDENGNYITATSPAVSVSSTGQKTNVANN